MSGLESQRLQAVVAVSAELVEAIAERAAQLVLARLKPASRSPYMTIPEAAEYARCRRQRIDDLLSSGRLTRYKDGRRTLVSRAELEARLNSRGPSPPPRSGR